MYLDKQVARVKTIARLLVVGMKCRGIKCPGLTVAGRSVAGRKVVIPRKLRGATLDHSNSKVLLRHPVYATQNPNYIDDD